MTDNINTNIKQIEGVEDCHYSAHSLSLAIYYSEDADLFTIQVKVAKYVSDRMLYDSVETYNYYSMMKESHDE